MILFFDRIYLDFYRIDELYLDKATPKNCYRLETYRSAGSISANATQQLRCYFVSKCNFPENPPPSHRTDGKTDIRTVSDPMFLEKASENTLEIYQEIMWNVESRYGPVIEVFEVEGTRERRLVIGYKMGGTTHFFSALSNLYHFYSLYSARKYVGASVPPVFPSIPLTLQQSNSRMGSPSFRSISIHSLTPVLPLSRTRFSKS